MADPAYRTPAYRAAMARWCAHMARDPWTCRRCGLLIPAGDRGAWDLGHLATGLDDGFEPEHRACNRGHRELATFPSSRNWWE